VPVESHPFGFAQGRLLRNRPRKDGAPGSRKSRAGGVCGIPPLRKRPRKDGAPGKTLARVGGLTTRGKRVYGVS